MIIVFIGGSSTEVLRNLVNGNRFRILLLHFEVQVIKLHQFINV